MASTGDRLIDYYANVSAADPITGALVIEAARICDRLDELDGIISGRVSFMELMHFRMGLDGETVTVTMDNALVEARQQANVLKGILVQLSKVTVQADKTEPTETPMERILRERAEREKARQTG